MDNCKLSRENDGKNLQDYALCLNSQKDAVGAEYYLLKARVLDPWNNGIQHTLGLISETPRYDLDRLHLLSLRFPWELWLTVACLCAFAIFKVSKFKHSLFTLTFIFLFISGYSFYTERKFQNFALTKDDVPLFSHPNFNYETDRVKKGSLLYVRNIRQGFSEVIYNNKKQFVASDKLFLGNNF